MHLVAAPSKRPSKQVFTDATKAEIRRTAKEIRKRMGWSQEELGRALGHHQTTASRLETDGGCTHEVFGRLRKIANGLGIQLEAASPVETEEGEADEYPNRGAAVRAARLVGLSPAAIEQVQAMTAPSDGEPSPLAWFQQIMLLHQMGLEGPRPVATKKR